MGIDRLRSAVEGLGPVAVAVSGGVDSLTLALALGRIGHDLECFHAVSAAVPGGASERVRAMAGAEGWTLAEVEAGEFSDPDYLSNPVDRCFFCKQDLYGAIRAHTERTIVSGTNADDLSDYRPGLDAAERAGVRHPFVEAGISKPEVRSIALGLGYPELARLPASPCLSSRIETGIRIEAEVLRAVDGLERWLADRFGPEVVRVRVRAAELTVELDERCLGSLSQADRAGVGAMIASTFPPELSRHPLRFAPYSMGSAFLLTQLEAGRSGVGVAGR